MLYILIFIVALLALYAGVLISKAEITIEYISDGDMDLATIQIEALFFLRLKYQLYLPETGKHGMRLKPFDAKDQESHKRKENINPPDLSEVLEKIKSARFFYKKNKGMIKKILGIIYRKTEWKKIRIDFWVGTGDAFTTSLANGALWAAAGTIFSLLPTEFCRFIQDIHITADFSKKTFSIKFICIIRARIAHIIVIIIKIYIYTKKLKDGGENVGGASD